MNNLVKIGEAKNNKKLLELGKEITQIVIDRFEESYFFYVRVEDIKDETLISIGKKLYSNPKAFMDYLRNSYEEENFEWDESVVNSYDLIHDIVSSEIVNSGEYFFDYDSEFYLLATDISEVEKEEKLTYKLNEIKKQSPLVILLNKEREDFIFIRISDDEKYFILENRISSFDDECIETKYLRAEDEEYVSLVDNITKLLSKYTNLNEYKQWTDDKTAHYSWDYMKDSEEFENIASDLSSEKNPELYAKLVEGIVDNFKNIDDSQLDTIKKGLSLYYNGEIDALSDIDGGDSYLELKELIWKTVHDNFKEEFISDKNYVWKPMSKVDKFKLGIENELNKLLDINSFKFREVLPKEVELTILKDYGLNRFGEGMKFEISSSYTTSDYLDDDCVVKKHLNMFLNEGSLKNLAQDELNFIYSEALRFKEVDFVKDIGELYLKEYIMNILIDENESGNRFLLIGLYHLMLEDFSKIEPHIEDMLSNGFSFEKLNDRIKNLQSDIYEFEYVNKELKTIFNSYISKANNAEACTVQPFRGMSDTLDCF